MLQLLMTAVLDPASMNDACRSLAAALVNFDSPTIPLEQALQDVVGMCPVFSELTSPASAFLAVRNVTKKLQILAEQLAPEDFRWLPAEVDDNTSNLTFSGDATMDVMSLIDRPDRTMFPGVNEGSVVETDSLPTWVSESKNNSVNSSDLDITLTNITGINSTVSTVGGNNASRVDTSAAPEPKSARSSATVSIAPSAVSISSSSTINSSLAHLQPASRLSTPAHSASSSRSASPGIFDGSHDPSEYPSDSSALDATLPPTENTTDLSYAQQLTSIAMDRVTSLARQDQAEDGKFTAGFRSRTGRQSLRLKMQTKRSHNPLDELSEIVEATTTTAAAGETGDMDVSFEDDANAKTPIASARPSMVPTAAPATPVAALQLGKANDSNEVVLDQSRQRASSSSSSSAPAPAPAVAEAAAAAAAAAAAIPGANQQQIKLEREGSVLLVISGSTSSLVSHLIDEAIAVNAQQSFDTYDEQALVARPLVASRKEPQ